jgi:RNA polymerase sigma factor (sigma-70 family)
MQPRETPIQMFSTFAQLAEDRFSRWLTDARLQNSMATQTTNIHQSSEQFWVLHWYKLWQHQPHSLASRHLGAYLQEACFWAAQKTHAKLRNSPYSLADCFQIALLACDRLLTSYNPQHGSRLKDYARVVFQSAIKNALRQRGEIDICSDWALLRKLSQKRFIESLKAQGLTATAIERYRLAWEGYKALYAPAVSGSQRLPQPDRDTWDAIATLYNQHRQRQLDPNETAVNAAQIETWLQQAAKAARVYLYPSVKSLNAPMGNADGSEWLETLADPSALSAIDCLAIQEEETTQQQQHQQIKTVLSKAIAALKADEQTLLHLYYSQQLTQQDIANQLNTQQYAISRRLSRLRTRLLKTLVQWTQEQESLVRSLDNDQINQMGAILEEWLSQYFTENQEV